MPSPTSSKNAVPLAKNPFEQIAIVEREELERTQKARTVIEQKRIEAEEECRKSEKVRYERARKAAGERLIEHKSKQVPILVQEEEKITALEMARIGREANTRVDTAAKLIVNYALSPSFSSNL